VELLLVPPPPLELEVTELELTTLPVVSLELEVLNISSRSSFVQEMMNAIAMEVAVIKKNLIFFIMNPFVGCSKTEIILSFKG
jgi:hypothetical protein